MPFLSMLFFFFVDSIEYVWRQITFLSIIQTDWNEPRIIYSDKLRHIHANKLWRRRRTNHQEFHRNSEETHLEHGDSLEKPISNHPSHSHKDAHTHARSHSLHEMMINITLFYICILFFYLVLILMTCESNEIGICFCFCVSVCCVCVTHNPVSSTLFAWKSLYFSFEDDS